ncbi:hypothetical protein CR513_60305, partial [Mucuna pruriens]
MYYKYIAIPTPNWWPNTSRERIPYSYDTTIRPKLLQRFNESEVQNVSYGNNSCADTLARLATAKVPSSYSPPQGPIVTNDGHAQNTTRQSQR